MRIAILGGTFDPIHNGHLAAAQSVSTTFAIDEVHFVPSFSPPHKDPKGITSPFHRFAMVALATAPEPRFHASSIELDAMEKRYTVDTLELLRRSYPQAGIVFVMGTDMYADLRTWKDFRRLFELANLAIVNRPGFAFREDVAPFETVTENRVVALKEKTSVFHLPFVEQAISATEIRERCREGQSAGEWLPPAVWNYIQRNRLYS